jgi:hypothetical protein
VNPTRGGWVIMLSIGVAIYLVNVRVTEEAEQTLQRAAN